MAEDQRNARIFGVLFIITFLTSIPALALYQPVLDDPAAYIAGDGKDSQIYLAGARPEQSLGVEAHTLNLEVSNLDVSAPAGA